MNQLLGLSVLAIAMGAPALGLYRRTHLMRLKNGKCCFCQQAQGPFVPTGEEKYE